MGHSDKLLLTVDPPDYAWTSGPGDVSELAVRRQAL